MKYRYITAMASGLLFFPAGALAEPGLSGVIVGGVGMLPEYQGSDDYNVIPFGYLNLRYNAISLEVPGPRAKLGVDIGDHLTLGIIGGYRGERDALATIGAARVDDSIDAGAFVALKHEPGWLNQDSLSFRLEGVADVGGATDGMTFSPSLTYAFFAGRAVRFSFDVSAGFADDNHMAAYFDAAGFSASGGLKEVALGTTTTVMFSQHWGVSARASWSRLVGDAAESPVSVSDDQFLLGGGLTYRF